MYSGGFLKLDMVDLVLYRICGVVLYTLYRTPHTVNRGTVLCCILRNSRPRQEPAESQRETFAVPNRPIHVEVATSTSPSRLFHHHVAEVSIQEP